MKTVSKRDNKLRENLLKKELCFPGDVDSILLEVQKYLLKKMPKEKRILWPQNGCNKDCKECKIEVANYNQALKEVTDLIKEI